MNIRLSYPEVFFIIGRIVIDLIAHERSNTYLCITQHSLELIKQNFIYAYRSTSLNKDRTIRRLNILALTANHITKLSTNQAVVIDLQAFVDLTIRSFNKAIGINLSIRC